MKRKLRFSYSLVALLFLLTGTAYAQVSYNQNFNDEDDVEWTNPDGFFWLDDYESCEGLSIVGELYALYGDGTSVSGLLGTSDGQQAQLSYSYKLLDYYDYTAYPNSYAWGSFTVSYGPSATGPWTPIETISPANHVVSNQCVTRSVNFTPPSGPVYLRLFVNVNENDFDVDALLYLDDVAVIQQACSGTPAAAAAVSSAVSACNSDAFTLSLIPAATVLGLTYQWQSSTNGTTFTNVATGGTAATYTTTQAQSTWYRAVVTCTSSGQSTNSTPILVNSTGNLCYCSVEFDEDIEPITYVNFAGINNTTSATVNGTPGLEDFTNLTPAEVEADETYTITLRGNTAGNFKGYFTVYIDFNHNGNLNDEGEAFEIGFIENSNGGVNSQQLTGTITIPANALAGPTRMRVFKSYFAVNTDPCSGDDGLGYGQAEDYTVNITVPCTTEAPDAEPLQIVCSGATIADLSAEGNLNKWYTTATGGEPLAFETVVTETTYYVSQTPEGGCESQERTAVAVEFSVIPPPVANEATQVFCQEAEVGDLEVEADGEVVWYTAATAGNVVNDEAALVSGTVYYAAQFVDGCESATRTAVTATINVVAPPVAPSPQSFNIEEGATIAIEDIEVEGTAPLTWYESEEDAVNNEDAINVETYTIAVGETVTLYVVQTVGECVSEPTPVTITVALGSDKFTLAGLQYYPNPVKDVFNLSYKNTIDVVEVYNLVGQCVARQQASGTEIQLNLAGLASGSYMVKVQSGTETGVIKIIKQ